MLRLLLHGAIRLVALLMLVVTTTAGLTRLTQAPLPSLLYSENGGLYTFQPGCESLLGTCSAESQWLKDDLYSLPVAQPSPDGLYVAVHHSEQWLIYQTDCLMSGAECKGMAFDPTFNDVQVAWGPDSSVLAYIDSAGRTLRFQTRGCWDEAAGECFTTAAELIENGALRLVGWSADGRVMVFVEVLSRNLYRLDLGCLDAVTGCLNMLELVDRFPFLPSSLGLAPDGEGLLYAVDLSGIRYIEQLYFRRLSQPEIRRVSFGGGASMPDWSSDGRYAAYAGFPTAESGDLALFALDMERGLTARLLVHPGLDMLYPAWGR